ncbi:hypothetical protein SAMN05444695_11874 [Rhodococcus triatomae]|uniref:Uncharacterized protein n=1 Tax=Rhodococcus triatomae TaxID=300028 RepID=A0A1G8RQH1_9NOCA|nr:hypothetical protein SAMN05444695_11874 [Rhodococcus triatomae]
MGSMVVVVDVPHSEGLRSLGLTGPVAGVEELLGQDAVVTFDLAVVPWGVGPDELMPGAGESAGEHRRPVAGAVVGDDPGEPGDTVGDEERLRPVDEPDCGDAFLVGEGFGISESGKPVDDRVQVHVSSAGAALLAPVDLLGMAAATAVHPPSASVGNPADLLHIDMHHVAGVSGDDRGRRCAVVGTGRVEESTPVQAEADQVTADGADRNPDALGSEFEGDAPG